MAWREVGRQGHGHLQIPQAHRRRQQAQRTRINPDKEIPSNLVEIIMKVLEIGKEEIYIQDDIREFNINKVSSGNVIKYVKSTENKVSAIKEQKVSNVKKVWNDTRKSK